jgi:hypothetical protein
VFGPDCVFCNLLEGEDWICKGPHYNFFL